METKLSYQSLKPHIRNLRMVGFYPLEVSASRIRKLIHSIYMRVVLILILLYTVQQIMKVYQVRNDPDRVMDTMFLLLTNSDSIYKQVVLWIKADQIEELLDTMRGPIFNQHQREHREFLSRVAQQAKILLRVFNIVALSTCLLWVLYPIILYWQGNHVEFAIWLPFDANSSPQFYYIIIYVWIQTSWLAFSNTTMDAFISFFFAQCKTQLSILRLDLETLTVETKMEMKETQFSFDDIFERRFRKILKHYDEILRFSTKIQAIFGGALLYQFLVSGWIICTTAYRTVNMDPVSVEFISMVMYMCCILTELFLYCYFGNHVAHESELLVESAYAMDWLQISIKQRRLVIIFMERIKKPILLVVGLLIPLSNSTFVSILKNSYSFYAFLKNTDE